MVVTAASALGASGDAVRRVEVGASSGGARPKFGVGKSDVWHNMYRCQKGPLKINYFQRRLLEPATWQAKEVLTVTVRVGSPHASHVS